MDDNKKPSAEPAGQHSFDDAAIERAALMHVAKDWHMISHLMPNYRCTEQFARLKAFAQELASGSAASGNTKPDSSPIAEPDTATQAAKPLTAELVEVEGCVAEDGVEHSHPQYGRGVFFTYDCMKPLYNKVTKD